MVSAEPVIDVQELEKTYRSGLFRRGKICALRGVSLAVPRGCIYGLLGPNGAGKTTLIKILLGIVRRSAGTATVLGHRAGQLAARRNIGYLPENHRIPRHLTGLTALEYYGCLSGLAASEVRQRTPELIDRVGLAGRAKERVSGYSKGMQQRLGLAQAMLHKPELIVLDEPTDGVDPVGRKEIREVLKGLAADGATIFLNSHLLQEIELICEQVAILNHGRVLRTGSVQELTEAIRESATVFQLNGSQNDIQACVPEESHMITHSEQQHTVTADLAAQSDTDRVVDALRQRGVSIISMHRRAVTLEEAFLEILKETGT